MVCKWLRASCTAVAALLFCVGSASADGEKKPGARPAGAEFLKRFDKNGNGTLDPDEAQAAKEAGAKFRSGKDGKPGTGGFNPERMKELMKKFDKNGDGQLDDSEKAAAKEAMMKLRGGKPGQGPGGAEFMKRFDKNGDGQLDDAEKAAAKEAMQKFRAGNGKPGQRKKPEDK